VSAVLLGGGPAAARWRGACCSGRLLFAAWTADRARKLLHCTAAIGQHSEAHKAILMAF